MRTQTHSTPPLRAVLIVALSAPLAACAPSAMAPPPRVILAAAFASEWKEVLATSDSSRGVSGPTMDTADPCRGARVDVVALASHARCEARSASTSAAVRAYAVAPREQMRPGAKTEITVVFWNTSNSVADVAFAVKPFPRFSVETYDLRGRRLDAPPSVRPVSHAIEFEEKTARVTLDPGGKGVARVQWTPPRALRPGRYVLHVVTPMRSPSGRQSYTSVELPVLIPATRR